MTSPAISWSSPIFVMLGIVNLTVACVPPVLRRLIIVLSQVSFSLFFPLCAFLFSSLSKSEKEVEVA